MLDKKLEEAKRQNAQKRQTLIMLLIGVGALCALILVGVSSFDFSPKAAKEVVSTTSVKADLSQVELDLARETFKEKLKVYENDIEPSVQAAPLESWNGEVAFEIKNLKEKALKDYSEGGYTNAINELDKLSLLATQTLKDLFQLYTDEMTQAQTAFAQDNYDMAKLHVEKALSLNPTSEEALDLKAQVDQLPEILSLMEAVKVADVENDLVKERDLLLQVSALAPDRQGVKERLSFLNEKLKGFAFEGYISQGFSAISKRHANGAREAYQAAKTIYPDRDEVALLYTQLLSLEKEIRVSKALNAAKESIRKDDWAGAKTYFETAQKDAPNQDEVVSGIKRADQIIGLKSAFSEFEKNPYRLTNANYRKTVEQALLQSEEAGNYSFSLMHQADKISKLMNAMNQDKAIDVVSDNQTFVQVRSVGKVGKILQKTIHLKPGSYTFEGLRDGFKSALIQVLVPFDKPSVTVKVICDERI
jgi:tetratricopeptide (TPR) repeat protein